MNHIDNLYAVIAGNIRSKREKGHITQAGLAERADISVDTVKSVESGRRSMSLDTYLRIVRALGTTPLALMHEGQREEYLDRLFFLLAGRKEGEIEYVLYMVEHLLKGMDRCLE